jgi:hypothetical protein
MLATLGTRPERLFAENPRISLPAFFVQPSVPTGQQHMSSFDMDLSADDASIGHIGRDFFDVLRSTMCSA